MKAPSLWSNGYDDSHPTKRQQLKKKSQINGIRIHQRNPSSRLASKPSSCTEKEYGRMVHVCRLHRSQQTLPERSIRATTHWSDSWFNSRICPIILDCYSGYHQIALKEQDQSKTSFITPFGSYCYKTMSFGLKNAGATYQRAIQTCLGDQIGEIIEAYVDDVVVKTKNPDTLIEDLKQTFENLKRWRWKLNPNKCVFGVLQDNY